MYAKKPNSHEGSRTDQLLWSCEFLPLLCKGIALSPGGSQLGQIQLEAGIFWRLQSILLYQSSLIFRWMAQMGNSFNLYHEHYLNAVE